MITATKPRRTVTCIECNRERTVAAGTKPSNRCPGCAHKLKPHHNAPAPPPPGGFADLHPERHPRLACRDRTDVITLYETAIDRRPRPTTVISDAHAYAQAICEDCPLAEACQTAAEVERYTGIAGGHVWAHGRRAA